MEATRLRLRRRCAARCLAARFHHEGPRRPAWRGGLPRERSETGRKCMVLARATGPKHSVQAASATPAPPAPASSPGPALREGYPPVLDELLDPSCDAASFAFPRAPARMSRKRLNVLISALAKDSATCSRARLVLDWLERSGYPADAWMYTEVLRGLRREGRAGQALAVYDHVRKIRSSSLRPDSHFYAEAMLAASKGTAVEARQAERMWRHMLRDSAGTLSKYALTAFLCACSTSGEWERAWRAFHVEFFAYQPKRSGGKEGKGRMVMPDVVACTALLRALRAGNQPRRGEQLVQWMHENGISPNVYTYTELIGLLGDCSEWEKALAVFNAMEDGSKLGAGARMPRPSMHTYAAILAALDKSSRVEIAERIFRGMVQRGLVPNPNVTVAMLSIYEKRHLGQDALDTFRWLQRITEEKAGKGRGAKVNVYVYNVLLSALSKSEAASCAREVFDQMEHRDRVSWETLIAAYGHVGDVERADQTFAEMVERGFRPTDYAYVGRIKARGKKGQWREAVAVLKEAAIEGGMKPTVHMYNAVLAVCGAWRKWELAVKLYEQMVAQGVEPNDTSKDILSKVCNSGIEEVQDRQRQAATISAIAAAAGAVAIRTGIL